MLYIIDTFIDFFQQMKQRYNIYKNIDVTFFWIFFWIFLYNLNNKTLKSYKTIWGYDD